jgi:hypothetical protein
MSILNFFKVIVVTYDYKTLLKYLESTLFILITDLIVFLKLNQFRANF